jgi:hypothetical protein
VLRNKTFINAHLIKNRLTDVDTSMEFKYKSKFLALESKHLGVKEQNNLQEFV